MYLDYTKAFEFDKVDHKLLLKKLKAYGIGDHQYDWIKPFLSNRLQTVVVGGHHA